jgi:hypothetical protein
MEQVHGFNKVNILEQYSSVVRCLGLVLGIGHAVVFLIHYSRPRMEPISSLFTINLHSFESGDIALHKVYTAS